MSERDYQGYDEVGVPQNLTEFERSNFERNPEPSVEAKDLPVDGLAPWDADKFGWKLGQNGNRYLMPHPDFVASAAYHADNQISNAIHDVLADGSDEAGLVTELVRDFSNIRETLRAIGGEDGTEEKSVLRFIQTRAVLAAKIAGSTQFDRECRMRRHLLSGKEAAELQENEYFMKAGETRDKWARYGAIWQQVAAEVMPEVTIDYPTEIGKLLNQEAIEKTRQLRKPTVRAVDNGKIDAEFLKAACL